MTSGGCFTKRKTQPEASRARFLLLSMRLPATNLVDDQEEQGNSRRKGSSTVRGIRQRYPLEDGVAPAAAPGNRRYRRLLNDKILRDMAGPLTAEEMEQLYAPPPWGLTPPKSAFEEAAETREWDSFRCIDMDVEMEMISQDGRAGQRRKDESGSVRNSSDCSRRWHSIGKVLFKTPFSFFSFSPVRLGF